jgi:predicted outer membrane repeat protein
MAKKFSTLRALLCALVLVSAAAMFGTRPALAAGVVGNGNPASCTETALDNALSGGGLVTFNCGANTKTLTLTFTKNIQADTTLDGGNKIILRAPQLYHFQVYAGYTFNLKNITLQEGTSGSAGAIENYGTLNVTRVTFYNNRASGNGGAIANYDVANIKSSTFTDNFAENMGGAIYHTGSALTINKSKFINNQATNYGGAVATDNGVINIKRSKFASNNTLASVSGGGALNLQTPTMGTISNSTIDNNYATDGGGIASNGDITVSKTKIINNIAGAFGGGVWQGGNMTLIDSTIDNNRAVAAGGIDAAFNVTTLTNSTVSRNEASDYAGGILTDADAVITNSTISGNYAAVAGSALWRRQGNVDMQHVTVANNTYGGNNGSGIYSSYLGAGVLYLQNTVISNNGAVNCGGQNTIGWGSYGNNLSSDASCVVMAQGGDKQNKNAKLGALANNGGPTLTHLPLAKSPLINKGANVGVSEDQRGMARPVGNADIGAVEVQ